MKRRTKNKQQTTNNKTIGLLGGSFNPPHIGHLQLSLYTLKKLHLKRVWWLVSPGNPMKNPKALADFHSRLSAARALTAHDRNIVVSGVERLLGTRYTIDTLIALQKRSPRLKFIWLMGADNLAQFHRWKRWREIAKRVPIAVVDRAPFSHASLRSPAALYLRRLPTFTFLHMPRIAVSSSGLRNTLGTAPVL